MKGEIRKAGVLAVGEACEAVFRPTQGLKKYLNIWDSSRGRHYYYY